MRQAAVTCPGGFGGVGSRPAPASEGGRQRLSAGHGNLWAAYTGFAVVQELYDGYAADPLAASEKPRPRASVASGGDGGGLDAGPDDFLGRYLDRQAEIEGLLKQRPARRFSRSDDLPASLATSPSPQLQKVSPGGSHWRGDANVIDRLLPAAPAADAGALDGVPTRPLRLERKTPNVRLDGEVLTNDEWSGGAMFVPPDDRNFRFTVAPMDELDTCPVFVGIAPADADLSIVNFFDVDCGVFLCMGGAATQALSASCGAPGGPCFHTFGKRSVSVLPVLSPGYTLSVAFEAAVPEPGGEPEGRVYFVVGDMHGEGIFYDKPKLPRSISARGWRPCLLMCTSESRLRVLPFQ
jgi:hypothetical protein